MESDFLYIDILGFSEMVKNRSTKIPQIFEIINGLSIYCHYDFTSIAFSDTIVVFNKNNDKPPHYYVTYLIEFAQQLFYRLLPIGVYFKGIITYGEFSFTEMKNINAYWGMALLNTYHDESGLEGFGLFINNDILNDVAIFDTKIINAKYSFVFLCQSYMRLYKQSKGILPANYDMLTESDDYAELEEELRFFREIEYLKDNYPSCTVRKKYAAVYEWYKEETPLFFKTFEKEGFLPYIVHPNFVGRINPIRTLAEIETTNEKKY